MGIPNETPFSMIYGTKAVIPIEISLLSLGFHVSHRDIMMSVCLAIWMPWKSKRHGVHAAY